MTGKKELSTKKRAGIIVLVTAVLLCGAAYAAMHVLLRGPSAYAGRTFARAVKDVPVISDVVEWIAGAEWVEDVLSYSEDTPQRYSVYPQID